MEKLSFELLLRLVIWDYNRNPFTESLTNELFRENYGMVMGDHYYEKFIYSLNGDLLKMIAYFRGENKEGHIFCNMIMECIEKYEQRIAEKNQAKK